jgi:hypothetical protein
MSERESMPYDVVIVGAGPAGLSAAIRIKQQSRDTSVCILEKGSEVGAHILSGAVIDPKALDELLPDWRNMGCSLADTPVNDNQHWILTKTGKFNMPHFLTPGFMHNKGTYTGSLGNLCRWLAGQAENLGVEIFPGFSGAEILYNSDGSVKGVATGDMGIQGGLLFGGQAVLALAEDLKLGDLAVDLDDLGLGVPQTIFLGLRQRRRCRAGGTPGRTAAVAAGQHLGVRGGRDGDHRHRHHGNQYSDQGKLHQGRLRSYMDPDVRLRICHM